ncbi:MAG: hypothetical protein P8Y18_06445 [Candidatus Bathyarchaeota archaeon]
MNSKYALASKYCKFWKNGKILYEDNKLVNYSLGRYLERQISDEMFDISQIGKITVNIDQKLGDDIIFQIFFYKK